MAEAQTGVRLELAQQGSAQVATGLPVLDHLLGELARTGRLRLALEVAPGAPEEEASAAGRGLGRAIDELIRADDASGSGWAFLPAEEALAAAALEVSE